MADPLDLQQTDAFPEFPTLFGEEEQKRLDLLTEQKKQMEQIYSQKFTEEAWQQVSTPEKVAREFLSNSEILSNVVEAFVPWEKGWDFGMTPEQAQEELAKNEEEYLELVRRKRVTSILPTIQETLRSLALIGKTVTDISSLRSYFRLDALGFNDEEQAYVAEYARSIAFASTEDLISGNNWGGKPITQEDVDRLFKIQSATPLSSTQVLSTVAFSKDLEAIGDALKTAFPSKIESNEETVIQKVLETYISKLEELGLPIPEDGSIEQKIEAAFDTLEEQSGELLTLYDEEAGVLDVAVLREDNTVWKGDELLGTFDESTGHIMSTKIEYSMPTETEAEDLWHMLLWQRKNIWESFQTGIFTIFDVFYDLGDLISPDNSQFGKQMEKGKEWVKEVTERNNAQREEWLKEHPEFDTFAYSTERDFTNPYWWGSVFTGALPTVIGTVLVIGTSVATANPLAGAVVGAAFFVPLDIGSSYDEARAAGATDEEARLIAQTVGSAIGLLDVASSFVPAKAVVPTVASAFRKKAVEETTKLVLRELTKKDLLKKGFTSFLKVEISETITEVLQEAMQNAAVSTINENIGVFDGLTDVAIHSAIITAPFALVGGISNYSQMKQHLPENIKKALDASVERLEKSGFTKDTAEAVAYADLVSDPNMRREVELAYKKSEEQVPQSLEALEEKIARQERDIAELNDDIVNIERSLRASEETYEKLKSKYPLSQEETEMKNRALQRVENLTEAVRQRKLEIEQRGKIIQKLKAALPKKAVQNPTLPKKSKVKEVVTPEAKPVKTLTRPVVWSKVSSKEARLSLIQRARLNGKKIADNVAEQTDPLKLSDTSIKALESVGVTFPELAVKTAKVKASSYVEAVRKRLFSIYKEGRRLATVKKMEDYAKSLDTEKLEGVEDVLAALEDYRQAPRSEKIAYWESIAEEINYLTEKRVETEQSSAVGRVLKAVDDGYTNGEIVANNPDLTPEFVVQVRNALKRAVKNEKVLGIKTSEDLHNAVVDLIEEEIKAQTPKETAKAKQTKKKTLPRKNNKKQNKKLKDDLQLTLGRKLWDNLTEQEKVFCLFRLGWDSSLENASFESLTPKQQEDVSVFMLEHILTGKIVVSGKELEIDTEKIKKILAKNEQIAGIEATEPTMANKQKQLEIINKTNPAPNNTSTWIRNIDDIKTAQEVFAGEDFGGTPDFTQEMADTALETGKIKIYSSFPIKDGVFVTPSKQEAQNYAGSGKVYERIVNINDVAWIDDIQGQLATITEPQMAKGTSVQEDAESELATLYEERERLMKERDSIGDELDDFASLPEKPANYLEERRKINDRYREADRKYKEAARRYNKLYDELYIPKNPSIELRIKNKQLGDAQARMRTYGQKLGTSSPEYVEAKNDFDRLSVEVAELNAKEKALEKATKTAQEERVSAVEEQPATEKLPTKAVDTYERGVAILQDLAQKIIRGETLTVREQELLKADDIKDVVRALISASMPLKVENIRFEVKDANGNLSDTPFPSYLRRRFLRLIQALPPHLQSGFSRVSIDPSLTKERVSGRYRTSTKDILFESILAAEDPTVLVHEIAHFAQYNLIRKNPKEGFLVESEVNFFLENCDRKYVDEVLRLLKLPEVNVTEKDLHDDLAENFGRLIYNYILDPALFQEVVTNQAELYNSNLPADAPDNARMANLYDVFTEALPDIEHFRDVFYQEITRTPPEIIRAIMKGQPLTEEQEERLAASRATENIEEEIIKEIDATLELAKRKKAIPDLSDSLNEPKMDKLEEELERKERTFASHPEYKPYLKVNKVLLEAKRKSQEQLNVLQANIGTTDPRLQGEIDRQFKDLSRATNIDHATLVGTPYEQLSVLEKALLALYFIPDYSIDMGTIGTNFRDAAYVFGDLQEATGLPFFYLYERTRNSNGYVLHIQDSFLERLTNNPKFKHIVNSAELQAKVSAELLNRGKPDYVRSTEDSIAECADAAAEVLDEWKPIVRMLRFLETYEQTQDPEAIAAEIHAPVEDIKSAILIYTTGGEQELWYYLLNKTWGVIGTGYNPEVIFNPAIELDKSSLTSTRGASHLKSKSREFGNVSLGSGDTFLKRFDTYNRSMGIRWFLRSEIKDIAAFYALSAKKFKKPKLIYDFIKGYLEALQGIPTEMGSFYSIINRIQKWAYPVVFSRPWLGVRNYFQVFWAFPDRANLFRVLARADKKLPKDLQALTRILFDSKIDQSGRPIRDFVSEDSSIVYASEQSAVTKVAGKAVHYTLGMGARVLDFSSGLAAKIPVMSVSDKLSRSLGVRAAVLKAWEATEVYNKDGDFKKWYKNSGIANLTKPQQEYVLSLFGSAEPVSLAIPGLQGINGQYAGVICIGEFITNKVLFMYDKAASANVHKGVGKAFTSLLTFPRSVIMNAQMDAAKVVSKDTNAIEKKQAIKNLIMLMVAGEIISTLLMTVSGNRNKEYSITSMLAWEVGGLTWGVVSDASAFIADLITAVFEDDEEFKQLAINRLPSEASRLADTLVGFYKITWDVIEAATDEKAGLDIRFFRQVRAFFDENYTPEEQEKAERTLIEIIQKVLMNTEQADPTIFENTYNDILAKESNLGVVMDSGDIFTLQDLGSSYETLFKKIPDFTICKENGFSDLALFYKESREYWDLYYKLPTTPSSIHTEARREDVLLEAMLLFWGKYNKSVFYENEPQRKEVENLIKVWYQYFNLSANQLPDADWSDYFFE